MNSQWSKAIPMTLGVVRTWKSGGPGIDTLLEDMEVSHLARTKFEAMCLSTQHPNRSASIVCYKAAP